MFQQGIVISAATLLLSIIVIGYILYQFAQKKNSFFSSYTSDIMVRDRFFITKAIVYGLYIACAVSTFFIFFTSFHTTLSTIGGVILALSAVLAVALPYLTVPKHIVYYSTVYFVISGAGSLLAGLAGIFETQLVGYFHYPLWLAVVFIIIGIAQFAALFVPSWWNTKFQEKCEDDGKVTYVRPRISLLSVYQWSYLAVSWVEIAIIFVASFFIAI